MPSDRETVVTLDNGERITFPAGMSDAQIMTALHKIRTDSKQGTEGVPDAVAKSGFASSAAERAGQLPLIGPAVQAYLDTNIGAAKSVGNTVLGVAKAAQYVPGMTTAVDTLYGAPGRTQAGLAAADAALQPTNTTQALGKAGADVAQFFAPIPGVGKGKAAIAAKDAALTLLQTGSPTAAAASAGISAALPAAGVAGRAAGRLKISAEKTVAQALGATKEWAKAEATKLAPEILKRGVKGTRDQMLAQARRQVEVQGDALNQAYAAAQAAGQTVDGPAVRDTLKTVRDSFHLVDPGGDKVPIAGTEGVIAGLKDLEAFVAKLGDNIPIDQAVTIKRTWDKIIDKAGLFGPKATASATDSAYAWAVREGAGAFRELLNASPDIATLNKEVAFWTGLKKVLKATELRTQAQGGGLLGGIAGATGFAQGLASGDTFGESVGKAVGFAALGKGAVWVLQHPHFRTAVSGPMKNKLADALASGSPGKIESAVHAITKTLKALPSQAQQALQ